MADDKYAPRPSGRRSLLAFQIPLLVSRKSLCALLRSRAVYQVGAQSAAGDVVPIEKPRAAPVGEAYFEAAAQGDGFVRDDADAIDHPEMIPRSKPTGNRLEIVGRARRHRRELVIF